MADEVGALVARVVADTEQFRAEMTRVSRQLETNTARMNRALSRVSRSTSDMRDGFMLATRVAATFGVALGMQQLVQFAGRAITAAAELKNLSEQVKISVEVLSTLQYIARVTDTDFNTLTKSVQFMNRTIGEGILGNKQSMATFRALGIELDSLSGLTADERLAAISDQLNAIGDDAVQTAMQVKVFGRSGTEIARVTQLGSRGIREMTADARSLGIELGTSSAEAADRLTDEFTMLKEAIAAAGREAAAASSGPLADLIQAGRQLTFGRTASEEGPYWIERLNSEIEYLQKNADTSLPRVQARLRGLRAELLDWQLAQPISGGKTPSDPTTGGPSFDVIRPGQRKIFEGSQEALRANQLMAESEILLTNTIKEQNEQRLASAAARIYAERDIQVEVQEAAAANDTARGQLLAETLRQRLEERLAIEEQLTQAVEEHERIRAQAALDAADRNVEAARYAADAEIQMRQQVVSASLGFLNALGAEHRGAAIAALAIQKALAIKQILVSTKVAGELAYASQLIPGDPTSPLRAEALRARVLAGGRIAAGLVAATGLIEAAQISSGGTQSTLGTSANPISTRSDSASATVAAATARERGVQVIFQGDVFGWDDTMKNKIVASLRDLIENKDVVIFGPNSRQAAELLGG